MYTMPRNSGRSLTLYFPYCKDVSVLLNAILYSKRITQYMTLPTSFHYEVACLYHHWNAKGSTDQQFQV